ncbi:MAG: hypothetical protein V8T26_02345 [[Eubacterium] siraeum]
MQISIITTIIYYKSDGSIGVATRYASTHAKLGVSKNGVTQQAICIEAGVSYSTGSSYVGKDTSDAYMQNLPPDIQQNMLNMLYYVALTVMLKNRLLLIQILMIFHLQHR